MPLAAEARLFEPVTVADRVAQHDVILYEYSCAKTGKWRWYLGTVREIIASETFNCSVAAQDWILPSSTRASSLTSLDELGASPNPRPPSTHAARALDNGALFAPATTTTTVPHSAIFAKFRRGSVETDQPILLSRSDLAHIGQLLRKRRDGTGNVVNPQDVEAAVRSILREDTVNGARRSAPTDQRRRSATSRSGSRVEAFAELTPDAEGFARLPSSRLKLEEAKISALELVVRDEEGSRLAVLKDESYQVMNIVVDFFHGLRQVSVQEDRNSQQTVNQAMLIEELRYRLRVRQQTHLCAVETLQTGVEEALGRCPVSGVPADVQRLIDVVDVAVDMLSRDGCEQDVFVPTPIPDDARRDMALRFASVRSNAGSRCGSLDRRGSQDRRNSLPRDAVASRTSLIHSGNDQPINPYRSPSRASSFSRPPIRRDGLVQSADVTFRTVDWGTSEPSVASRASEQDRAIAKLRAQLEEERDLRLSIQSRMSQMATVSTGTDTELDDGAPFNETIALQRRMLQQLQLEVSKRLSFMNILEEQLRIMRRSKHKLMTVNRSSVRQSADDTEQLYAQFNRRIAILQTQLEQVQEEVNIREKEIRGMKALLASAVTLTSDERRGGSYARRADDYLIESRRLGEERLLPAGEVREALPYLS